MQAIADFLLDYRITSHSPVRTSLAQKLGSGAGLGRPLPRSIGAKASGGAAIEGATLGQLLKRPEVKIEDFLPLLEQAIPYALEGSCPACPAASGARVRAELKAAETAIKYDG